jgi:hypothetical protein
MSDIDIQSLNNFLDPTKNNDKVKDKLNFFCEPILFYVIKSFYSKGNTKVIDS